MVCRDITLGITEGLYRGILPNHGESGGKERKMKWKLGLYVD